MRERVPYQVSHDSQQNRAHYQCKPCASSKAEFMQMIDQPALDRFRQKPHQRRLYESVEEPKHKQREGKSQNKDAGQSVPEPAMGIEAKKIFEVRREGANQQSRKYKAEASKGESCGTVGEGEGHSHIIAQPAGIGLARASNRP